MSNSNMTIEQIESALKTKYNIVNITEFDYLYQITCDNKQVKVKKSTLKGKKMPLTIKNLLK